MERSFQFHPSEIADEPSQPTAAVAVPQLTGAGSFDLPVTYWFLPLCINVTDVIRFSEDPEKNTKEKKLPLLI